MKKETIYIEHTFNVAVSKVWQAITNHQEMKSWCFDIPGFKAEVGHCFQFYGGENPEKQYLHLCEVLDVIFETKLTYSWRFDGYTGNSFVTFHLTGINNHTKLQFTHSEIDTFADENPDFAIENFIRGWTSIIHTSLKNYLEGVEK